MNRIDTPQSPYELSRALAELTRGEVTSLTLGRTQRIEGIKGEGLQRQISARVDGERRIFVAKAIDGRVSIHEGGPELEPNKMHEFLKRVDEARERRREKAQEEKAGSMAHEAQAGAAQSLAVAIPPKTKTPTPSEQAAKTLKPANAVVEKAAGWPARNVSHPDSANTARAAIRRR